ncbi:hypothetical protein AM593_01744, partial [Mytilus galloprovincialis]
DYQLSRQHNNSSQINKKNIFCLPRSSQITIPIPRKDKRAFLTKSGLAVKVQISHTMTSEQIKKIVQDKFGSFFDQPFQYTFLSTTGTTKSKRLHRAKDIYPNFVANGRDLNGIATRDNIYMMSLCELKGGAFSVIFGGPKE